MSKILPSITAAFPHTLTVAYGEGRRRMQHPHKLRTSRSAIELHPPNLRLEERIFVAHL